MTTRTWRVVSVSEIGAGHLRDDIPCQDSSGYFVDSDTLVACVADGAGSVCHSDRGSRMAVDAFISTSRNMLDHGKPPVEIACAAFDKSRNAVLDLSEGNPRPYATTLIGLIVVEDDWAAIQIGDGAILMDRQLTIVSSHSGEYANETRFITDPDVEPDTANGVGSIARVSIITDGLEGIALESVESGDRRPYGGFFDPLYRWLEDADVEDADDVLRGFLSSERVRARTQDDVTLLLAMR